MRLKNKEEITMSKSIASKTLAIAKKQEAERLEAIKEDFLDIMRKEFGKRVDTCNPWTAVGTTSYIYKKEVFNGFNSNDLKTVAEEVGFKLKSEYSEVFLSIPEWVKGQKRTQAQLMLYWSNIEIKRTIKSRKEAAKKMCKEALEKLKNGDFETSGKWGNAYEITVKMSYSENTREFQNEVERLFAKKNILLVSIDVESGEWRFRIKEN